MARLTILTLALMTAGCSSSPTLVPVAGKITVKGQPLATGTVQFLPEGTPTNGGSKGVVNGGSYVLHTDGRPGAPPGRYKVTVVAREIADSTKPPTWLAHPRYASAQETPLSADVQPGAPPATYDFDLQGPAEPRR